MSHFFPNYTSHNFNMVRSKGVRCVLLRRMPLRFACTWILFIALVSGEFGIDAISRDPCIIVANLFSPYWLWVTALTWYFCNITNVLYFKHFV